MNTHRFSDFEDTAKIKSIFVKTRDHVTSRALFDWNDQKIEAELVQSQFYLSVTSQGDIQAFICFREAVDAVEILALGTAPEVLRSGIMKMLLDDFAHKNSKNGKTIHLEVHKANHSALSLYEKSGFKTTRVRKAYYSDGSDAIEMVFTP